MTLHHIYQDDKSFVSDPTSVLTVVPCKIIVTLWKRGIDKTAPRGLDRLVLSPHTRETCYELITSDVPRNDVTLLLHDGRTLMLSCGNLLIPKKSKGGSTSPLSKPLLSDLTRQCAKLAYVSISTSCVPFCWHSMFNFFCSRIGIDIFCKKSPRPCSNPDVLSIEYYWQTLVRE